MYIPINTSQPIKRKERIIENSDAKIILSFNSTNLNEFNTKIIDLRECIIYQNVEYEYWKNKRKSYDDEAYIIFTSGTTGDPKGVVITHRAAINTIIDVNKKYKINENDVFLGLANLSFDLSVYDIFGSFLAGGTLVLPDSKTLKDPNIIYNQMLLYRVSVWNSVPAQMQLITNFLAMSKNLRRSEFLRTIILSGDWIPIDLPEKYIVSFLMHK